jgi:hypothetical protein
MKHDILQKKKKRIALYLGSYGIYFQTNVMRLLKMC